jgi:acetoin utilization deacetylase AcuC-like enzyme
VADIEPAFSRIAYFNFHRDPRFSNFSKTYAEMPDDEHWRGNLRTQHRTGDDEDRSWVEEIVALADRHFPPLIQPSR